MANRVNAALEVTPPPWRGRSFTPAQPPPRRRTAIPDGRAEPTDGELVTLALNGSEPALTRLFQRHAAHLRNLIVSRLRNADDALDVMQDTYVAVWRALHTYDVGRPFQAWLSCIALNKCRDWARRRSARLGLLTRLRAETAQDGAGIDARSVEGALIETEYLQRLGRALTQLPPQLREPLVLTALEDHSQAAVACRLALTVKAVETRVRRARHRLVQHLQSSVD